MALPVFAPCEKMNRAFVCKIRNLSGSDWISFNEAAEWRYARAESSVTSPALLYTSRAASTISASRCSRSRIIYSSCSVSVSDDWEDLLRKPVECLRSRCSRAASNWDSRPRPMLSVIAASRNARQYRSLATASCRSTPNSLVASRLNKAGRGLLVVQNQIVTLPLIGEGYTTARISISLQTSPTVKAQILSFGDISGTVKMACINILTISASAQG